MAKASIQQFSTTASSNTDVDGISVATGWPPSNVGPAFRELMALLASSLVPLELNIAAQIAVTPTPPQASAQAIQFTGALAADCTVTLPNALFIGAAQNMTTGGHNVILSAGVGTTVTVPNDGTWVYYWCDGATNVAGLPIGYGSLDVASLSIGGTGFQQLLQGYIGGLTLTNDNTNPTFVLDVAAGSCTDSTQSVSITLGAFTKSTAGAWVAGSGNNGMGAGLTITADTWYHVMAIINAGNPDVYFDTSVTAANAPAGTTAFRRIGSFAADGSANIIPFVQTGDNFSWFAQRGDVDVSNLGGSDTAFLLSVPSGVRVQALFNANGFNGAAPWQILFRDPLTQSNPADTPAGNVSLTQHTGLSDSGQFAIWTDTLAQITAVASQVNTTLQITTHGWVDLRGRFD